MELPEDCLERLKSTIASCPTPDSVEGRNCLAVSKVLETSLNYFNMLTSALDSSGEAVVIIDGAGTPCYINMAFGYLFKITPDKVAAEGVSRFFTAMPQSISEVMSPEGVFTCSCETKMLSWTGEEFIAAVRGAKIISPDLDTMGCFFIITDISEKKKAETERERLISELREALENVRTLRNLLPICSACKNIRDDNGSWHKIETYISKHSDAKFTHGVCPDCSKRLYPELYEDDEP